MIEIFVHRAIFENKENSLEGIEFWLKSGFNIEIDVRKNKQEIYLSHDKQKNGDLFRDACKIINTVVNDIGNSISIGLPSII